MRRSGPRGRAQEAAHEQDGRHEVHREVRSSSAASTSSSGPTGEMTPALLMSTALSKALPASALELVAGVRERARSARSARRRAPPGMARRARARAMRRVPHRRRCARPAPRPGPWWFR